MGLENLDLVKVIKECCSQVVVFNYVDVDWVFVDVVMVLLLGLDLYISFEYVNIQIVWVVKVCYFDKVVVWWIVDDNIMGC